WGPVIHSSYDRTGSYRSQDMGSRSEQPRRLDTGDGRIASDGQTESEGNGPIASDRNQSVGSPRHYPATFRSVSAVVKRLALRDGIVDTFSPVSLSAHPAI